MQIAVASGKGGTGKTTVAVNLALSLNRKTKNALYCDCDVEAPDGHIFLKPEISQKKEVNVSIPIVDENQCDGCGECSKICHFSAIVVLRKKVLTYPELCHSCGGCKLVCPQRAIMEIDRSLGMLEIGTAENMPFRAGKLNIGEARAVPVISQLKEDIPEDSLAVIDCPPGTSCPVIEAMRGVDYVILVTEPTPFGLNDLRLAVETTRKMGLPFGIIINRADVGDNKVVEYCQEEDIHIIASIPFSREVSEKYAHGMILIDQIKEQQEIYTRIADQLMKSVGYSLENTNSVQGKQVIQEVKP